MTIVNSDIWITSLRKLYSVTYFLKVKYLKHLWNRADAKMHGATFPYLLLIGVIVIIVIRDLDLLFEVQRFGTLICLKWWELVQICMGQLLPFWNLPLNDNILQIVLCDLDLHFKGDKSWNVNISEIVSQHKNE